MFSKEISKERRKDLNAFAKVYSFLFKNEYIEVDIYDYKQIEDYIYTFFDTKFEGIELLYISMTIYYKGKVEK